MSFVGHFVLILILELCVAQDSQKPKFRIMAPQFVCPKDEEALIEKPDETIIMIQKSADTELDIKWTVRWTRLPAPSQRFTLLLWQAIRALEAKLNEEQPVPYVYVIENEQLVAGVDYIFTAQATTPTGTAADPKKFHIDNSQGDKKLNYIEGRGEQFSINMLGSTVAYADVDYVVEAQVTTCRPTEDYHFQWTVTSVGPHSIDASQETGARLLVSAKSLKPDLTFDINCKVIRTSNGELITQTGLPFQVLRRGLEVYLSADHLQISVETPFDIEVATFNHDFFDDQLIYHWTCTHIGEPCDFFESVDANMITLYTGLPNPGSYEFAVRVNVKDESGSAKMTVTCVEAILPVLQITPVSRLLNEKTIVSLEANASNVAPSCKLTWYFTKAEDLAGLDTCTETGCKHGVPMSETLTIFSLEENFLNELTDFTNETEWRQVIASMPAHAGRARFVAECGCSLTFSCETQGMVYAEVNFEVNGSPKPCCVMSSPESGLAMESLLRLSTLAVSDPDTPLRYSFYCGIGANSSLLLGFYYDHLAVETFLPYIEGGTEVWVEVCDARNACYQSPSTVIALAKGDGRTVNALIDSARGHLGRCDVMLLQRVAVAALVSYTNTGMVKPLAEFSSSLTEMLATELAKRCQTKKSDEFADFLLTLSDIGFVMS